MKSSTFPKIYYNDLSDNGKSFEFGYDSTNDAYGYYKNGVFTGFGGGGVSTKCVIKSCVFFPVYNVSSYCKNPFNIYVLNQDGSFYTTSITINSTMETTMSNFITTNSDFISNIEWWTPTDTYYGTPYHITVSKDGYYSILGMHKKNSMTSSVYEDPTFFAAGSVLYTSGFYEGTGFGIFYLGIEIPN